jgi:hypothetical protein
MSNWSIHPGNAGGFLFHNDEQKPAALFTASQKFTPLPGVEQAGYW